MAHQQRMSLEVEISNYRKEDIAQQGVVANLHKQKTQLAADAENAAAELAAAQADCQAKDTIIAGLHAQVSCWPCWPAPAGLKLGPRWGTRRQGVGCNFGSSSAGRSSAWPWGMGACAQ